MTSESGIIASVDALRRRIANEEAGLRAAKSPRARLGHVFRLTIARDALSAIEEG